MGQFGANIFLIPTTSNYGPKKCSDQRLGLIHHNFDRKELETGTFNRGPFNGWGSVYSRIFGMPLE